LLLIKADKLEYFKIQDDLIKMSRPGIVITTAAGNDSILCPRPDDFLDDDMKDCYKKQESLDNREQAPIFVVGGIDDTTSTIAEFSNFGPPVNIYENATDIEVACSFGGYMQASDTSFAAPIVAANIAFTLNQVGSIEKLNDAFNAKYRRKPLHDSGSIDTTAALNSACLETRKSVIFSKPTNDLKPETPGEHKIGGRVSNRFSS
jgi:subtilisin family serine protease